jgi:hypothetical protein
MFSAICLDAMKGITPQLRLSNPSHFSGNPETCCINHSTAAQVRNLNTTDHNLITFVHCTRLEIHPFVVNVNAGGPSTLVPERKSKSFLNVTTLRATVFHASRQRQIQPSATISASCTPSSSDASTNSTLHCRQSQFHRMSPTLSLTLSFTQPLLTCAKLCCSDDMMFDSNEFD